MKTSVSDNQRANQRGVQHWDGTTGQLVPREEQEKIEDQTQPSAAGPQTLQDNRESLDSLFVKPASGPEQSRTN